MTEQKIVWFIEDNKNDADEYGQLFEKAGDVNVVFVSARPAITDYTDLLTDDRTGAIIVDQRLSDFSGVSYDGIELADYLRYLRPELPIFMLTNYADDELLQGQGGSVDSIIDKKTVRKRAAVYVRRILRSMEHYQAALTKRQARLKELIDRKLSSGLNEAEEAELKTLRADVERPLESEMSHQEEIWKAELQAQEDRLARLEAMAQNIRDALQKSEQQD